MTLFCKYCGKEIAEDSVYCSWCGKNITETTNPIQKIKIEDTIKVSLYDKEKQQWQSTENLEWSKPYIVRTIQVLLLLFSITSMVYGIVWFIIGGKTDGIIPPPSYNNIKNRYELLLYKTEPLNIVKVRFDLNEFENGKYYEEWQRALEFLYKQNHQNYNNTNSYPKLSSIVVGYSRPPYVISSYYEIADKNSKVLFRTKILFLIILPALIVGIIIVVWMHKIRFPSSKDKLPRDFADKIEVYSWSGFRVPKYVFFQKDNKYGVIDASKYNVAISAQYDDVIWREQNVSFDATINNKKETIIINQLY